MVTFQKCDKLFSILKALEEFNAGWPINILKAFIFDPFYVLDVWLPNQDSLIAMAKENPENLKYLGYSMEYVFDLGSSSNLENCGRLYEVLKKLDALDSSHAGRVLQALASNPPSVIRYIPTFERRIRELEDPESDKTAIRNTIKGDIAILSAS